MIDHFFYRVKTIFRNTEIEVCFLGGNKFRVYNKFIWRSGNWVLVIFVQFKFCFD